MFARKEIIKTNHVQVLGVAGNENIGHLAVTRVKPVGSDGLIPTACNYFFRPNWEFDWGLGGRRGQANGVTSCKGLYGYIPRIQCLEGGACQKKHVFNPQHKLVHCSVCMHHYHKHCVGRSHFLCVNCGPILGDQGGQIT
jgi:hypothetical protein